MNLFRRDVRKVQAETEGRSSYYNVVVDGQINPNAAWYYPQPKEAARQIAGYIAFWKGVRVSGG